MANRMAKPWGCGFMPHSLHSLHVFLLGALLTGFGVPAHADTVGLRVSPNIDVAPDATGDANTPASLHFRVSSYDGNFVDGNTPAPLLLSLPQGSANTRNSALSADWFLFSSGLRTSAGLMWSYNNGHRSGNLFDAADNAARSRAFLGLGWTSSGSSSSSGGGVGWRLDADVGLSLSSPHDCVTAVGQCLAPASVGLKPDSGGDGIRWNPYISIGASFQY
jgi:hypothetical protein